MFKKFVRSLLHLTWNVAQIVLMTIAWFAVYTVLIVNIIKSVRK